MSTRTQACGTQEWTVKMRKRISKLRTQRKGRKKVFVYHRIVDGLIPGTKIVSAVIFMFQWGLIIALTAGMNLLFGKVCAQRFFRSCIYILDHHCFFLGQCVGRKNLKFFLLFCFYACVGCAISVLHILNSLTNHRDFWSKEIMFYFLPFSLVMFINGTIPLSETLQVSLINFGFGASLMTLFLFFTGVVSVFRGTTPYEAKRHLYRAERQEASVKLRNVFGSMGALHILFPLLPAESPYIEPGYRRLATHHFA